MSDSPPVEMIPTAPTGELVESRAVAAQTPPADRSPRSPRPTFQITCWLLALIAFLQVVTIGTALTKKIANGTSGVNGITVIDPYTSTSVDPRVAVVAPRTLDEIMSGLTDVLPPEEDLQAGLQSNSLAPQNPPSLDQPSSRSGQFPAIADPQVERLVKESRQLSMDGDIIRAMLKLEEAGRLDPTEPAVMFHKGGLYESMSHYVKAGDQYEQIQKMGMKAGVYFKLAAGKLTEGMDTADAHRDVLSIKTMHASKIEGPQGVRAADVTLSISARPDTPINPDDVEVNIYFYDSINGEKVEKSADTAIIKKSWVNSERTWQKVGNEEALQVSYQIPASDYTDEYLFGKREYYGFVVELVYKGEVIDQQARPRRLHSVHGNHFSPMNNGSSAPWFPEGGGSLLPSLENESLPGYVLPPLPSRR